MQNRTFLRGCARWSDWETPVPAVFGVSATDFETGWRNYLAQHYFADSHAALWHYK